MGKLRELLRVNPRHSDAVGTEAVAGSPTYDARIDPTISAGDIIGSERLTRARDLYLFYDKTAPASDFSHYWESQPSPLAAQMVGLASSRDAIDRIVSRKDLPPYPGVELGHVPSIQRSPDTAPMLGGSPQHLTHHAHQLESYRASRRRFGH